MKDDKKRIGEVSVEERKHSRKTKIKVEELGPQGEKTVSMQELSTT